MLSKSSLARSLALVRQSVDRLCHHRHVHITFSTLLILNRADFGDWMPQISVHCMNGVVPVKSGPLSFPTREPGPDLSVPHPPKMLDLGRGRHSSMNYGWQWAGYCDFGKIVSGVVRSPTTHAQH